VDHNGEQDAEESDDDDEQPRSEHNRELTSNEAFLMHGVDEELGNELMANDYWLSGSAPGSRSITRVVTTIFCRRRQPVL
jgi:hypothetical protein